MVIYFYEIQNGWWSWVNDDSMRTNVSVDNSAAGMSNTNPRHDVRTMNLYRVSILIVCASNARGDEVFTIEKLTMNSKGDLSLSACGVPGVFGFKPYSVDKRCSILAMQFRRKDP